MAEGEIYKGEDFLYLVEIEDEEGEKSLVRPFDQTDGGTSITSDDIEIETKDRTGTDYGNVTQEVSLEGNITEGDPFPDAMRKMIHAKKFVKIYEVNTRTNKAEFGMYKIDTFDRDYSFGDSATYTLDATLFGDTCETTLTELPEGAPALEGMDCEDEGNGVEG